MDTFLVLCPTHRDRRELALMARKNASFVWHDYASLALEDMVGSHKESEIGDPLREVDYILEHVAKMKLSGVISTDDYPGSALACIVAQRLRLPAPNPNVNLTCQHKYLSRREQLRWVPDAVPAFSLLGYDAGQTVQREIGFPAFIKPVKSFFSIGAQRVDSPDEVASAHDRWSDLGGFLAPFEKLLFTYTGHRIADAYLIGEGLLTGVQATVEGYASNSRVHILGVVDSVMFPGTLAFERFEYPSSLPEPIQARMSAITRYVMQGLNYQNGMFNVEFMYDRLLDQISIIEINPRMASQFADLYEKVDGTNSYQSRSTSLSPSRNPMTCSCFVSSVS